MISTTNLKDHIVARCLTHPTLTLAVSEDQVARAFGRVPTAADIRAWAAENGIEVQVSGYSSGQSYVFRANQTAAS